MMPPRHSASGGSRRRIVISSCAIVLALGVYGFLGLGSLLAAEDGLRKGDAIFVLAGSHMDRQLEAADLYLAGYGPRIVLSRQVREQGETALAARGVAIPEDVERVREVLIQLGIPQEAIVIPLRVHNSTAAEAITLRELSAAHGWRRLIVVSSKYHLRRAGFAIRRELRGSGIDVLMRATRYDTATPERWWQDRTDMREVVPEALKLVAYLLGLGA
jgi:uncharacterized SAM-binding protein YcdF (DUF218 family)